MSFFTRAIYYLHRKKAKTIINFLLFSTVASFLVAMLSLSASVSGAIVKKHHLTQTLTLTPSNIFVGDGHGSGELPEKALQKIASYPEVENFVPSVSSYANLEDAKLVPIGTAEGDYRREELAAIITVEGISNSHKDNRFQTGMLKLKSGRHIKANDHHKILVHKDFAKHNNLKVGDYLTLGRDPLRYIGKDKTPLKVEIIGIFSGKTFNRPNFNDELVSNTLLSDTSLASDLFGFTKGKTLYSEATYSLKKSAKVKAFITKVKQNVEDVNWQNYQLTEQNPALKSYNRSIGLLQKTVKRLVVVTMIASGVLLILLLIFNIYNRLRECGVLLALGKSKLDIISQYIVENILLAIPSFVVASLIGKTLGQWLANRTVDSVTRTVREEVMKQLGGYSLGADSQTDLIMQTVKHFQVNLSAKELISMVVISGGLIILGILAASVPIMLLKPKDILNKIS
ncbi:ABC transporter permease [Streptococcus thoraltensis]|uniref:ABC transporter permease n=1 Tax=Streptococcus thoraltensis TaxID=55085 RepID=UPI001F59E7AB|nr:ABC transporter permease [Streptococcus thoraltensis]